MAQQAGARGSLAQAMRLQLAVLVLVAGSLRIVAAVAARQSWGWLRVKSFRLRVRVRRALARYMKKRRVARVRRLVLCMSFLVLVSVLASRPGPGEALTAAAGLAGIVSARLAPGKLTASRPVNRK